MLLFNYSALDVREALEVIKNNYDNFITNKSTKTKSAVRILTNYDKKDSKPKK